MAQPDRRIADLSRRLHDGIAPTKVRLHMALDRCPSRLWLMTDTQCLSTYSLRSPFSAQMAAVGEWAARYRVRYLAQLAQGVFSR